MKRGTSAVSATKPSAIRGQVLHGETAWLVYGQMEDRDQLGVQLSVLQEKYKSPAPTGIERGELESKCPAQNRAGHFVEGAVEQPLRELLHAGSKASQGLAGCASLLPARCKKTGDMGSFRARVLGQPLPLLGNAFGPFELASERAGQAGFSPTCTRSSR